MPESCYTDSAGCGNIVAEMLGRNNEMVMGMVLGVVGWQVVGVAVAFCLARNRQTMEERVGG